MVSWKPCGHLECRECAVSRLEKALVVDGDKDRHSLVCPSQDFVCYNDIVHVLRERQDLLALLHPKKMYNLYEEMRRCPSCEENIWFNKNYKEQRCHTCHYEFCSNCKLTTHDGKTCEEKRRLHRTNFKAGKTIINNTGNYFRSCTDCGGYAQLYLATVVVCEWCPLVYCLAHANRVNFKAPCCAFLEGAFEFYK